MEDLINKLANFYSDRPSIEYLLLICSIDDTSIPFHPAAAVTWSGIINTLKPHPQILLTIFSKIIDKYPAERDFLQTYIDEVNAGTFGNSQRIPVPPAPLARPNPLMASLPLRPSSPPNIQPSFNKRELKKLVTVNKIPEVFIKLTEIINVINDSELENKIVVLNRRFVSLQDRWHKNIIAANEHSIDLNTIVDSILHRIDEIWDKYRKILAPTSANPVHAISPANSASTIDLTLFNKHSVFDNELSFINRQGARNNFKKMLINKPGKRVLLIEGESKSGLTHIQLYFEEILIQCDQFILVKKMIDPNRIENILFRGIDLAMDITKQLNLDYEPEESDKLSLSKYTTFFTKLKGYADIPNAKIPFICLDGMHHVSNPDLDNFIGLLINEAIMSKKYYVIFTNNTSEENKIKDTWPSRLKSITPIVLKSFTMKHVKSFVKTVFLSYDKQVDMGYKTADDFLTDWLNTNEENLNFDEEVLNVMDIGEICTKWYKEFSMAIETELDES